jgi:hypothetical protein
MPNKDPYKSEDYTHILDRLVDAAKKWALS